MTLTLCSANYMTHYYALFDIAKGDFVKLDSAIAPSPYPHMLVWLPSGKSISYIEDNILNVVDLREP